MHPLHGKKRLDFIGDLVVTARDPEVPWVRQVVETARAHHLRPVIIDPHHLSSEIERRLELANGTRIVVNLREMNTSTALTLEGERVKIGGSVIFFGDSRWEAKLAPALTLTLLKKLPHATRCVGIEALKQELNRITMSHGAW